MVMLLWRFRKPIIIALLLVVLMLVVFLEDDSTTSDSCRAPGGSSGVSGPVSADGLAYPTVQSAIVSSAWRSPERPNHRGIDFAAPSGTDLYAFADGTVVFAQDTGVGGFGGWIVLEHRIEGALMSTTYGHIDPGGGVPGSTIFVKPGDTVTAGQRIGISGNSGESTGPHLHFELWNGVREQSDDVDPQPYFDAILGDTGGQGPSTTAPDDDSPTDAGVAPDNAKDRNAATIIAAGKAKNLSDKGITIGLAVALVEADMLNLASEAVPESKSYPHDDVRPGDADSVGIMQQRPSQGWGAVRDLMDVEYAAGKFFDALIASGDWESKSFTEAAADVQRPREDLRGKYGDRQAEAEDYFQRLEGVAPENCGSAAQGPGGAGQSSSVGQAIVQAARSQIGVPYVWAGGDHDGPTSGGFDCSGLTMYAVAQATDKEVLLPHFTGEQGRPGQIDEGQAVDIDEMQPGDLVFFGDSPGNADHVGIYSGEQDGTPMMVHAPTTGSTVTEAPVQENLIAVRRMG